MLYGVGMFCEVREKALVDIKSTVVDRNHDCVVCTERKLITARWRFCLRVIPRTPQEPRKTLQGMVVKLHPYQ